ncbi:MAG: SDR family oxidoreductase, partial [Pseudomonadota bacterium]
DVSDERAVVKMMQSVRRTHGGLDALLNNAGIASMNHALLTPGATMERVFQTNVFGTFLFCREAAKLMGRKKFGRIVNFATVATPLKLEGEAVYAASKAAVLHMTKIMGKELAPHHITVNALAPGPFVSKMTAFATADADMRDKVGADVPLGRVGRDEDIAGCMQFLCGRGGAYVTAPVT